MLKSLLVIAFVGGVGSLALYAAQRPTVARGDILGADIVAANPTTLRNMQCDRDIEIKHDGARFGCTAEFKDGEIRRIRFFMDRQGMIHPDDRVEEPRVKKSSDPWD